MLEALNENNVIVVSIVVLPFNSYISHIQDYIIIFQVFTL